jgi:hypothetical protein
MDTEAVGFEAAWAGQAVGVQPSDQLGEAGGLVQQLGDREVHSRLLQPRGPIPSISAQGTTEVKGPPHQIPNMSLKFFNDPQEG